MDCAKILRLRWYSEWDVPEKVFIIKDVDIISIIHIYYHLLNNESCTLLVIDLGGTENASRELDIDQSTIAIPTRRYSCFPLGYAALERGDAIQIL